VVIYMNLREQADLDFSRARRRASFRWLRVRLQKGSGQDRLLCFEEARRRIDAPGGRVHRGLKTVRLTDVVGSVGRCSEFGGTFLPNKASSGARWKAVDRAFLRAEEFPPVSLYKLGDAYFVLDGNHRVSVARFHGAEWIDAEVTEFRAPPPGGGKGRETHGEPSDTGGLAVHDWMASELAKQRRMEMVRDPRKRRGPVFSLVWELKRAAGRLRKQLRLSRRGRG
jgi:hypothetical protein